LLCDKCGEREAEMQVTKIVGGEINHLNLCYECASELAQELAFNILSELPKFLKDFLDFPLISETSFELKKCPNCGLSLKEFQEKGRLGCAQCYDVFSSELIPLIRKVHGSSVHRGKTPSLSESEKIKKEVENLKKKLERLVREERFEEAAQVRDMIRGAEKKVKR
jgi:protein arginine kinase activator